MKWLIAGLLALCLVTPAVAGEDPYIAVVGNDIEANPWYFSPKHLQFLYDADYLGIPLTAEGFRAQYGINQPEVCDLQDLYGNPNARVTAGNRGWFDWLIRLPKKPSGEINLVFQCGILKPNAEALLGPEAIEYCAAETGERIGFGLCSRHFVRYGVNPILPEALPTVVAIALPGPFNSFKPFYLTAYKNPGTYKLPFWSVNPVVKNDAVAQLLDGSAGTRILLKACMDKSVVVKIPTDGQLNAGLPALPSPPSMSGIISCTDPKSTCCPPATTSRIDVCGTREETGLVAGDLIYVRLIIPSSNTVDIYCHAQSLRLAGIGESP